MPFSCTGATGGAATVMVEKTEEEKSSQRIS